MRTHIRTSACALLALASYQPNPLVEQARPLLIPAFGDLARELERRINLFDYPGALQILRQMRRETKNSVENQSPMAGKDQKRQRHGG